jgi:hypothetical protein
MNLLINLAKKSTFCNFMEVMADFMELRANHALAK